MTAMSLIAGVVFGLMLAELRVSREHERRLLARGAIAPSGDVYRSMALAYPAAFLAMIGEGFWRALRDTSAAGTTGTEPSWMASGVLLFLAAKGLKYWAIGSLGDRWTFKVIVEPGRPLVRTGPYRYVAHPNYIAIVGELAGTALMAGAVAAGPLAVLGFGLLLWVRVRFENRVLDA
jgi:methyltransferase